MGDSISPSEAKLLKELLVRFVDDIQKGVPYADAGWARSHDSAAAEACAHELCETSGRGVRVSASLALSKQLQSNFDEEGKDLLSIYTDVLKAVEIERMISRVVDPPVKLRVCAVGLAYMLQNSEFPISTERALQNGLGVDDWQIQISGAIPSLALALANKLWSSESWQDISRILEQSDLPTPKIIDETDQNQLKKISEILAWNKVVTIFREHIARVLGLFWYADDLIGASGIEAPESIVIVQKRTWSMVETEIGKTVEEVKREIDDMVEAIDLETREEDREGVKRSIASWADIFRLPW
jgi:hypothetical protein